ncbi:MAG: 16S rRNA (guanine(527)-N(7))-methyltransferase RsmG [Oscillospiraceae bacterium]|nr:16S rRNA (guanine(527)-N(7))-methyltransferase RsmG [Oscillospiraceae bacterium]
MLDYKFTEGIFEEKGLKLSKECFDKLDKYARMLVEKNKVMNLTGITEANEISEKHFLDSLLIFRMSDIEEGARVIDVGTGAGFPGLVMKIYRNDLDVTLLDSLNKRVNFLKEVSAETEAAECVHGRAEEMGRKEEYREKYDIAVARAVAAMPVLAEYCLPFVKVGGRFIALKGPNENLMEGEEIIKNLGGEIEEIIQYSLPCGDKRAAGIIRKMSACPTKYPRNSGQIMKKKN